jgi:NagD protein
MMNVMNTVDGVLYHERKVLPGALPFITWLKSSGKRFLFLTNSSERSPKELQQKLGRYGIHVITHSTLTNSIQLDH